MNRCRVAYLHRGALLVCFVWAAALASCGGPVVPSDAPRSELATLTASRDPALDEAIRFRETFGLRADDSYVSDVARDPSATSAEFGIPLLPFELAELRERAADARSTAAVTREYGREVPSQFGGAYIDPDTSTVVALFTADLDSHRDHLRARLLPGVSVELRQVANTELELNRIQDRIEANREWAEERGPRFGSHEVDIPNNVVVVLVRADTPGVLAEAVRHLDAEGMIRFVWDEDWLADAPRRPRAGALPR